ncbi:MAG TPA: Tc toxin subunit A, partial [Chitinophagaceae bacterium]|nr:Tc toxin subunit A [Chitinophagaceae bacterium]
MEPIVHPIRSDSQPDTIANLHEGLLKLGLVITKAEINGKSFGRSTIAAIRKLQVEHRLPVNGEIDAATAARLNQLLKRKGAFGLNGNLKPLRKAVIKNDLWKRSPADAEKEDATTIALVDSALSDYFIDSLADAGLHMDDKMKTAIAELKVDLRGMEHIPVSSLFRETILPELMKKEELKKHAAILSRKVGTLHGKKVGDLLQLQRPLAQHPAFQKDMLHTRNAGYTGIFKLSNTLADKLTELDIDIATATNDQLNELVGKQLIEPAQLKTLKLSGELARLTDDNLPLVAGLQKRNIQSVSELANLQKADWVQMIANERGPLPDGTTAEEYADRIMDNIDQAFPTKMLFNRLKHTPAVNNFIRNNPDLELAFADFFSETADEDRETKINWTGISAEEKPMVRKQMMAYQRVMDLGDDAGTRSALLEKGFDSAFSIADMSEAEFVKRSGLKKEDAKSVYAKATDKAMMAAHQWAAIWDVAKGGFKDMGVSNLKVPGLLNDLKDVDGMAELFGSQDYCDCTDCRSIFSPAAYFTDLMFFIEKNITNAAFDDQPNHPINLRTRRPDLWHLQLTCKNTNTLIPYLDVVNEVLETFLEKTKGIQDLFQKLSLGSEKVSFHTPFNLPLEETRIYLEHFSIKRADILSVLRKPQTDIKREYLELSKEEFDVITQPGIIGIEKRYGDLTNITIADVVSFAGITRKNLDELLALKSTDVLKDLSVETTKGANDIQPTGEKFKGLTKAHLDFIHRFVRLWKKVPYTIPEFDLLLNAAIQLSNSAQFSVTPQLDVEPADIQLSIVDNNPLNPVVVLKLAT